MPQLPGQRPPTTHGPVQQVPCPHCGKPNDLRELDAQNLLDTGGEIVCGPIEGQVNTGHCGRLFEIVGIRMIKVIVVRPSTKPVRQTTAPAQAARTVAPGVLRRLLGR